MMQGAVSYRCLSAVCGIEFRAGPRPGRRCAELAGQDVTDGACPVCGGLARVLSWYVVQCNPRAEAAVADKLRRMGHLAVFLHYRVKIRPRNRPQEIKRPLLPGYIFAGLVPPPDFYGIATLEGVAAILANEKGPAALDVAEVDRMRAGADRDGLVAFEEAGDARRRALEAGSVVRILSGPFQGFEGPVVQDDGRHFVSVRITMFGHERPVDVPYGGVELIAAAA